MREAEPKFEGQPSTQEVNAAADAVRELAIEEEGFKTETWDTETSKGSKYSHSDGPSSLEIETRQDYDKSLLVPGWVESMRVQARFEDLADGVIHISRGQMLVAAYVDKQDASKSLPQGNMPTSESLKMARWVVDQASSVLMG